MTNQITLQQLADMIGGNYWAKNSMERVYVDAGYNTKKMSTKTYVYLNGDGTFGVSCYIECPSQPMAWIKAQQEEVIQTVKENIERAIWEMSNPEGDYDEHLEQQEKSKDAAAEAAAATKQLTEKEKIANLTIDNVANYMAGINFSKVQHDTTLGKLCWAFSDLRRINEDLEKGDSYPPSIRSHMFERIFLKRERNALTKWTEPIGDIKVGETTLNFTDEVEFTFSHKQGNSKNPKNVFVPVAIPQHVTDALNTQLEIEKVRRMEYLKQLAEKYRQNLIDLIEKYKAENGN